MWEVSDTDFICLSLTLMCVSVGYEGAATVMAAELHCGASQPELVRNDIKTPSVLVSPINTAPVGSGFYDATNSPDNRHKAP